MNPFSAALKFPVYLFGLLVCAVVLPLDYLQLTLRGILAHALIALTRILAAPVVIVLSAIFDRERWPEYLHGWQRAHQRVAFRWRAPLRRFEELGFWLPIRRKAVAPSPEWRTIASLGPDAMPPRRGLAVASKTGTPDAPGLRLVVERVNPSRASSSKA